MHKFSQVCHLKNQFLRVILRIIFKNIRYFIFLSIIYISCILYIRSYDLCIIEVHCALELYYIVAYRHTKSYVLFLRLIIEHMIYYYITYDSTGSVKLL